MPTDPVRVGFFGKIPGRGDFVRAGLPRGFVTAWDAWLSIVLPASRAALGEAWLAAWMQAPVWRFWLAAETCGPDAMTGLWMPSVDRAGRHFPLTIVAPVADTDWLDAAEDAGRAALASDIGPDEFARMLPALAPAPAPGEEHAPGLLLRGEGAVGTHWWTEGAPRVPAGRRTCRALPDGAAFTTMLDSGADHAAVP